ncbi:MAG: hypothetical protein Q8K32_25360 [Archangium sp.]|nr:hypothetical protein [Archangium sp.]
MSTERRWLDEGASPEVTRLLESTVIDEPSLEQLKSLRARVAPLLETPPGGAPATAAAGVAGKLLTVLALLALGAGLGSWFSQKDEGPAPAPLPPAPATVVAVAPPAPVLVIAPPVVTPPPPRPRAAPPPVVPAPAPVNTGDEELELLQAAMSAGSPTETLTLVEQHVARFPASSLAQEREVLAVQALSKLGRSADARTRADAFKERWPTSTHLLRLQSLLTDP